MCQFPVCFGKLRQSINLNSHAFKLITGDVNTTIDKLVGSISTETLRGAIERFPHALERCTFFADIGYDSLVEAVRKPGANKLMYVITEEKRLCRPTNRSGKAV